MTMFALTETWPSACLVSEPCAASKGGAHSLARSQQEVQYKVWRQAYDALKAAADVASMPFGRSGASGLSEALLAEWIAARSLPDRVSALVAEAVRPSRTNVLPEWAPLPDWRSQQQARRIALALALRRVPAPELAEPSVEGGIGLWYSQAYEYAAVECANDGDVTLFYRDVDGRSQHMTLGVNGATLDDLAHKIRELASS